MRPPKDNSIILLDQTLESGKVTRYHAVPTVKPQTDAHHQWDAFVILMYITENCISRSAIIEMLTHDVGEYMGPGDVPFTAKRDNPEFKRISDEIENKARNQQTLFPTDLILNERECALIKLCDTLEGLIWCRLHEDTRGAVGDRWDVAFKKAISKFSILISRRECQRAYSVYRAYKNLKQ